MVSKPSRIEYPNPLGIRIDDEKEVLIGASPCKTATHVLQASSPENVNEMSPQAGVICNEPTPKPDFNFRESLKAKAALLAEKPRTHPTRSQSVDDQLKDLSIISGYPSKARHIPRNSYSFTNRPYSGQTFSSQPFSRQPFSRQPFSSQPLDSTSREEVQSIVAGLDKLDAIDLDLDFKPDDFEYSTNAGETGTTTNNDDTNNDNEARSSSTGDGESKESGEGKESSGNSGNSGTPPLRTKTSMTRPLSMPANNSSSSLIKSDLLRRLHSYRKNLSKDDLSTLGSNDDEEDLKRVQDLPEDVLKMIKYTADSPWLGSEISVDDEDYIESYSPVLSMDSPPSSATTPETAVSKNLVNANRPVSYPSAECDATITEPVLRPRKLTIEESDPVQENDRGRLFLQINKVSNLKGLPIDATRNPKFTLTLDNGQQAVNTDTHSVPVPGVGNSQAVCKLGQEFELIVGKDLQLTVTMSVAMNPAKRPDILDQPIQSNTHQKSPMRSSLSSNSMNSIAASSINSKKAGVRGVLGLNKKKLAKMQLEAEMQNRKSIQMLKEQEEEIIRESNERELALQRERQREIEKYSKKAELWSGITGPNGEYCRGYLVESHYEQDIYGSAKSFILSLYDEWNNKTNGVPRPVCDLHVTMLFVPKLYAKEKLPMSLRQCQDELQKARTKERVNHEGFLTQQGGDVRNNWRRRWFTLNGSEMTGYQEGTGKKRAVIHLENVIEVSEKLNEDQWCIYEDRAFQITFDDNESVAFYADSSDERNVWVRKLTIAINNNGNQRRSWSDLVIERETQQLQQQQHA